MNRQAKLPEDIGKPSEDADTLKHVRIQKATQYGNILHNLRKQAAEFFTDDKLLVLSLFQSHSYTV
jgi:hypothetical protein